jgi:hypothetical protein
MKRAGPGTHFENGRLFLVVTFEIKVSAGQAIWSVKSCFIRAPSLAEAAQFNQI